jgi:hypothetical protein
MLRIKLDIPSSLFLPNVAFTGLSGATLCYALIIPRSINTILAADAAFNAAGNPA